MPINPLVEERKRRLRQVLGMIRASGEIELGKLIAQVVWNLGVSKAKAREYIETLHSLGACRIEGGKVIAVEKEEEKAEQ